VLTLTSYGMVANAWRAGRPSSAVVALWKDGARGSREMTLEADAEGVLLTPDRHPAIRRAADGRLPEQTSSDLRLSVVTQTARRCDRARPPRRRATLTQLDKEVIQSRRLSRTRPSTGTPSPG